MDIVIKTYFLLLFLISSCDCNYFRSQVAEFCLNSGLNFLTISSKQLKSREVFKITKEIQSHNLTTKEIPLEEVSTHQRFYSDALMLIIESDELKESESFQEYLKLLKITKIKRSVMVFTTEFSEDHLEMLKEQVQSINENAMFQVMHQDENELETKCHQVISIKSGGTVINLLKLNKFGHMV